MTGTVPHSVVNGDEFTAGAHLPQSGSAASPDNFVTAGRHLEDLGFACGWFSDHLVVEKGVDYPPTAYLFEALTSLTWVAAHTSRLELGTSVLVMPMRPPTLLAKMLGSIDLFSNGRLVVGVAGGYVEHEFETLGVPFKQRGRRTDEAIEIVRRLWTEDPLDAEFPVHGVRFRNMRMKPSPQRHIPLWVGGHADAALRRAAGSGDGWHGTLYSVDGPDEDLTRQLKMLREMRPEKEFVLSIRAMWDGLEDDHDKMLATIERLRELGVTHITGDPRQRTFDGYLRSTEALAKLFERAGATMVTA
jgi:probable F420-dependent oxidoreductase